MNLRRQGRKRTAWERSSAVTFASATGRVMMLRPAVVPFFVERREGEDGVQGVFDCRGGCNPARG